MPRIKISKKEPESQPARFTIDKVRAEIFSEPIPPQWRRGQFVFNRASYLYGIDLVRSLKHDPFYDDANIDSFITELTETLNKLN